MKKGDPSGNPRYKPKFTISCRRRIVSLCRSSPTRRLYSRSYILRFNLSIVPGITEFRRKNNAYCGTHKAVGHKTPMSSQANSAQARTTCIFMSTIRSVCARVCVCVRRFFFLLDIVPWRAGPRCRTCDIAWLPASVATCNRQYRDVDGSNHLKTIPANKNPFCTNVFFYKFIPHFLQIHRIIYL